MCNASFCADGLEVTSEARAQWKAVRDKCVQLKKDPASGTYSDVRSMIDAFGSKNRVFKSVVGASLRELGGATPENVERCSDLLDAKVRNRIHLLYDTTDVQNPKFKKLNLGK